MQFQITSITRETKPTEGGWTHFDTATCSVCGATTISEAKLGNGRAIDSMSIFLYGWCTQHENSCGTKPS